MRYTIVGAGGIGGLQGTWMARAGCDVTFVDRWEEHVRAINDYGMYVDGARGEHRVQVPAITPDRLAELAPLEMVIVAVKSQDTRGALEQLMPFSTSRTAFVSMQAGLNLPVFEEIVGAKRTIGANPHYGGALVDPGHLEAGFPNYIWIGELDGAFTPRLRQLHHDLNSWTPTYMTDNIQGVVWSKFAFGFQTICTAITDRKFVEFLGEDRHKLVAGALVQEALALADALDLRLKAFDFFDPDAYRGGTTEDIEGLLSWMELARPRHEVFREHGYHDYVKTGSGMRWDILYRKRTSESTARFPAVKEAADAVGVPIPGIVALMNLVGEVESGDRPMTDDNFDRLADEIHRHYGASLPQQSD